MEIEVSVALQRNGPPLANLDSEGVWDISLDYAISQSQADFMDDDTHRHPGFVTGFGGGKTYSGLMKSIDLSLTNRGTPMVLMEPTYGMIERILWPTLFDEILHPRGIPYEFNKTSKTLKFPWGSEFWFSTAENPKRIIGTKISGGYVDECGLIPEIAWKNLNSRIRDSRANLFQLFATFTPEVAGWTHDRWGREELYGEPNPKGYKVYQGESSDNWTLGDYSERLADEWDEDDAQARIHGRFTAARKGRVYYTFDPRKNVTAKAKYDPKLPLGVCFDFNTSPGMHVELVQNRKDQNRLYVIDEVFKRNLTLEDSCKMIIEKYGPAQKAHIYVYGDANGRHTASKTTQYTIIKDIFKNGMGGTPGFRHGINIKVPNKNPSVSDSVGSTRAALCNAKGYRRLLINPVCKKLIGDFYNVRTSASIAEEGGKGIAGDSSLIHKGDPNLTHASDAVRYWIWQIAPIRDQFKRQVERAKKDLKKAI